MSTVERKCKQCAKPFVARAADVRRGWAKFCSKSCKATEQEGRTGQNSRRLARGEAGDDDADHCGHFMGSGMFGHGQE